MMNGFVLVERCTSICPFSEGNKKIVIKGNGASILPTNFE
jgi:hypothetical protein